MSEFLKTLRVKRKMGLNSPVFAAFAIAGDFKRLRNEEKSPILENTDILKALDVDRDGAMSNFRDEGKEI